MKSLRWLLAFVLFVQLAFASSPTPFIYAELRTTTTPQAIATQYSLTLLDATSDGVFAQYQAASSTQASAVISQMASNPNIVTAEARDSASPTTPGKGGTIPIVGDRAALVSANSQLLQLINWSPTLAAADGREVRVAILDTGLANFAGGSLWGKVITSQNFVEPNLLAIDRPLGTDSDGDGLVDEGVGHGTMVASVIDVVAPKTKFIIGRVANSDGYSDAWNVVKGIKFAIDNGAEVINLSLASTERSRFIANAIRYAEARGVIVIAGLGNDNVPEAYFPAKISTVVSVAGLSADGAKTSKSNWSTSTEVCAPGFSVVTLDENGNLTQWSGTSCATAFVSATIADVLRRTTTKLPSQIRTALQTSGQNVDTINPDYAGMLGRLIDHVRLNTILTGN